MSRTRWTPEKVADVQKQIEKGVSVAAIAKAENVSRGRIYAILEREGISLPKSKIRQYKRQLALGKEEKAVRKTIAFSTRQAVWLEEKSNISQAIRMLVDQRMLEEELTKKALARYSARKRN